MTGGVGFDAIIGQKEVPNPKRLDLKGDLNRFVNLPKEDASITDPNDLTPLKLDTLWVVPKGGEYFFSPSLKVLRSSKVSYPGQDD